MSSNSDQNSYKPNIGDLVHIKYSTNIEDHEISNITEVQNEIKYNFIIGSGVVTSYIENQICNMNIGQTIVINLNSNNDDINSIFDVNTNHCPLSINIELVSLTKKEELPDIMSSDQQIFLPPMQRMQFSLDYKNKGNHCYYLGKYEEAKNNYERSIKYLDNYEEWTVEQQSNSKSLKISLLLNISNCLLKLGDIQAVIKYSSEVLKIEKDNVKALYIRAVSNLNMGDVDDARVDLYKAATIQPQNAEVRKKLQECNQIINSRKKNLK